MRQRPGLLLAPLLVALLCVCANTAVGASIAPADNAKVSAAEGPKATNVPTASKTAAPAKIPAVTKDTTAAKTSKDTTSTGTKTAVAAKTPADGKAAAKTAADVKSADAAKTATDGKTAGASKSAAIGKTATDVKTAADSKTATDGKTAASVKAGADVKSATVKSSVQMKAAPQVATSAKAPAAAAVKAPTAATAKAPAAAAAKAPTAAAAKAPAAAAAKASASSATVSKAATESNKLAICDKPGECKQIMKFPLGKRCGWDCPPFDKCTWYCKSDSSASRIPAAALKGLQPVDEIKVFQYPKIVGSQVAMPLYQFTSEHNVLEAARRLIQAGSNSFKFDLKNQKADGKPIKALDQKGFLAVITHGELPYQELLDMPFRHFFFWAGRLPPPGRDITWTDIDGIDVYKEMYKLVVWLLKRYNGSGKTFYIGHWEGDWTLRDEFDKNATANPKKVQAMVKLLTDKQRAVDQAKKDNPWAKNVFVWHYAEANLVEASIKNGPKWVSMINTVIPSIRPVLDFVSVSVGGDSLREVNPAPALHKTMDYANKQLPAKPGVPGIRVFAGEFYFDMRNRDDSIALYAPTPEAQRQRGCWATAAGIAWGSPHMLWWAFYDNEQTRSGAYRGYWLVDNGNRETPLFKAYQQYYAAAQDFVRSVYAATGKPPTDYAFRKFAVETLIRLSGKTDIDWPEVRFWDK